MTRYQDLIGQETVAAAKEFFKYAKAVPADKLEWAPAEGVRTVLELAQECSKAPEWAVDILISEAPPAFSEESMAAYKAEVAEWTTIERCEEECQKRLDKLIEVFAGMTDERMAEKKWLPYEGGRDFTYQEMTTYPRWNFNYHTGQIAYIQTMYGDRNMY